MPIFSYNYPSSSTASASEAMKVKGPIIPVLVAQSPPLLKALKAKTEKKIDGWALIDTGANHTAIDGELAQELRLPVIDRINISTPSHEKHLASVYSGGIIYIKNTGASFLLPRAVAAQLQKQGILMLLGRDFLSLGILIYNGNIGSFSFSL